MLPHRKIRDFIQDGDELPTGEIRLPKLAQRLRVNKNTLWQWYYKGHGVGRGDERQVFFLEAVEYGKELRTTVEHAQAFMDAVHSYRVSLRRSRLRNRNGRNGK